MAVNDRGPGVDTKRVAGLIAEGIHTARIIEYNLRNGPQAPYWNYTLEINEDSVDNKKRIWATVSLSDAARWKMEEFLDAVGAPTDGSPVYGDEFVGQVIRIQVSHETWDKKLRAKVDGILPSGSAEPVSADVPSAPTQKRTRRKKSTPATEDNGPEL